MSQSLLIRSKILTLPSGRALFTLPPMVAIPSNQVNEHRMLADLELRNYSRVMSQSLLCRSMILLPLLNYPKYLNFSTTKRGMFSDASTFHHLRRKLKNIYIPRFLPLPGIIRTSCPQYASIPYYWQVEPGLFHGLDGRTPDEVY